MNFQKTECKNTSFYFEECVFIYTGRYITADVRIVKKTMGHTFGQVHFPFLSFSPQQIVIALIRKFTTGDENIQISLVKSLKFKGSLIPHLKESKKF